MHDGDKISDLQAGSGTTQPMLEITTKAITDSPAARGNESHRIRRDDQLHKSQGAWGKTSDHYVPLSRQGRKTIAGDSLRIAWLLVEER